MAKFLLNKLLHLLFLLSYLLLSNVISGAELINSSKNNYCINDDVIIESSFIDTLNYAVNWEYALDDNTWKNVSFLNISVAQSKQSLRLHDFTESLSLKIRCIYTDNITYIDSISNILNINIYPRLQAGEITDNQNICYNTAANLLTFSTEPTGGGNSYTYKWLQSNDNSTYTEIPYATNNTYQTPNLTSNRHYKAVVLSIHGCSTDTTNSVFVNVYQPLVAGKIAIGGLKTDTICYNTAPKQLTITQQPTGGNGTFTYQWQYSTNGTVWQNESGATQTTLSPANLQNTRFYRLQFNASCGTVYSDTVKAYVWNDIVKAEIGANQTICWNTIPAQLSTTKLPTGGNGKFNYQWQILQGSNWVDINGAIGTKYQPTALQTTTQYRLKTTSHFGCGFTYSDPVTITVYAKLQAGIITSNQNICYNTAANLLTFSTEPTGGGNSYTYKWLQSNDNATYTEIPEATNNTYQSPTLTSNRYYKAVVISKLGCSADTTNSVFVNVYQPLVAGKISIGGEKTDTICFNTTPAQLTITQQPTGGNGTFTYQWQYSTNGTVWQNESEATQTTLSPANLQNTRFYRLQFNASCGTVYSDTVKAYVWNDIVKAEIGANQTICWNTIPAQLTTTTVPTGGNGKFNYQWQILQGSNWVDINGAIGTTYQPTALQTTTQYRLKTTSQFGCGFTYSDPVTITVYAKLQAGIITSNQNICYNTAANLLTFSTVPAGGGNSYTYQWLQSNDNATYTEIPEATNNTYQSPTLTSNRYYKAVVISKLGCSADTTNSVFVNVYQPLVAGKISIGGEKTDTICFNTTPAQLTITQQPTGGNGTFTYQWQYSTNGTVWQNESEATQTTLSPANLQNTRFYRLQFNASCGTVYSDTVKAYVWNDIVKAEIGANQTICWNTIPAQLSTTKLPTGGNGKFNYQWQILQGSNWVDINGAIGTKYQPTALQTTTQYRLKTTSHFGCGFTYSDPVTITVYAKLQAGIITGNQNICYNTAANLLTFSTEPTGGGNSYSYKWLQSSNNTTFTEIPDATNNTYQTPNLTSNRYYKAVVLSNLGCSTDTTNSVFINVYQPLVAGKIAIGGLKTDTICYNTAPKQLTIAQQPSGGNGTFSYQWQYSTNGTVWQNENGATQTTLSAANLQNTRFYRLQFNADCGTVYSDTVKAYVWNDIVKAEIGANQTICWNTIPAQLSTTKMPTGGNGKFNYQWQILQGSNWVDINGAIGTTYQPTALQTTTQYRLKTTSQFGCGSIYSDPVTITVYAKLQAGIITGNQNICYNTAANLLTFSTEPTGGGNSYSYKWLQSSNNTTFTEIPDATNNTYQTPNLTSNRYYKAVVLSNLGCSTDTTNSVFINVYQPLVAGKIAIGGLKTDTICYNTAPKQLTIAQQPSGGNGTFSYQWQYSTNGTVWQNENSASQTTFSPQNLKATRFYRLQFNASCGTVYSDIVEVFVNPLPEPVIIFGDTCVCSNQYADYKISTTLNSHIKYEWSLIGGEILTENLIDVNTISVKWDKNSFENKITIIQTNKITSCQLVQDLTIKKLTLQSPERKEIIRKSSTNILISTEKDSGINYQWGFTSLSDNKTIVIDDSNRRFVQYPTIINTDNYSYWVKTFVVSDKDTCSTTSIYQDTKEQIKETEGSNYSVYPNPAKNFLNIVNNSSKNTKYTVKISSMTGRTIYENIVDESIKPNKTLKLDLPRGIYVLEIINVKSSTTQKLIIN